MAKGKSQKANILRQLERYKKYESSLAPKPKHLSYSEPPQQPITVIKKEDPELPQFLPRKRGMPKLCVCGMVINNTRRFCDNCKPSNRAMVGIKFVPQFVVKDLINLKPTGNKCLYEGCEALTERIDSLCHRHTQMVSKSYKYRTHVPNAVPHKLPSLDKFKRQFKRGVK